MISRRVLWIVWAVAALNLLGCGNSQELQTVSGKPIEFWLDVLKAPNSDTKQRIKAIHALSNVGLAHPQAIPALIDALDQPEATARGEAVLALLKIGPAAKEGLPALERIAQSEKDPKVRSYAEKALTAVRGG